MTKSFLFVKKRSLLLVFFIAISFCSTVFAQDPCLPATEFDIINPVVHDPNCDIGNGDCTSKDLYVLDAYLDTGDPCNSCDEGETITAGLYLTLVNDTGSTRTSFAIFGSVETTDKNGVVTTCSISRCSGPIPGNTTAALYYGDVEFKCGDSLSLVDLIQSWTDASPNSNCANHDCKEISPKCGFSDAIVITPPLQATTKAVCTSATTINIDLTVQGGVAPFTYAWTKVGDGGFSESTEDLTGVSAGTYNVTVTDANTCTTMTSITPEICCTDANAGSDGDTTVCDSRTDAIDLFGLITGEDPSGTWTRLTGSGGTFNAGLGTFTPSSEATNSTFKYTLSATLPCSGDESVATVNVEDAKDPGEDGLLTICSSEDLTEGMLFAVLGGSPDVGGIWSPALSGSGVYTYTIAGTEYCPEVSAKVTVSIEDAKDPGEDGLLTICSSEDLTEGMLFAALGGSPDVGGIWSPALSGSGVYTYTIVGTGYCPEVSAKVTVSIEDAKDPGTDGTLTICFGETVTASELFDSLNSNPEAGGVWSPLPLGGAGTYTYTFAATNICPEVSADVLVTEQSEITSSTEAFHVSCFGESDGKIILTVSGGTPPYTYLWSNGAKTKDISDLSAGLYSVKITDSRGCIDENSVRINQPDKLVAELVCGHLTCHSDTNGTLDLTVTGGTPPYTYLWSNGETVEDPVGLPGGIYSVVVTDANGCTVTQYTVISQPDLLVCNIVQDSPCGSNGGSDGVATVTAEGGEAPYTYLWDNGETTATAVNLTAGLHTVTVTDSLDCETTCEIIITEPEELVCSVELNNHVLCKGDSTGSSTVTASDGVTPYTYLWDKGEVTQTAIGLNAGLHSVTVTDANDQITTCTIMITEPDMLETSAIGSAVIGCGCYGNSDGSIDLTVSGGTSPYTYLWNNGETTEDLSGLSAGVYDVVVTDSNGCIATEEVVVEEPDALSCEITQDSPCGSNGASDGVATVTPSGGVPPYTYLWDNGETTATAVSLTAGLHIVTVTDSSGCETTCEITITEPNELRCDIAKVCDVTCFEGEDGSAKVTVEGGVPPYKYLWDNGETTQTATGLSVGLRSVTVTDSSESETSCNIMIEEPLELVASAEAEGATTGCSCYGNSDGSIDLTVSGGTSPYTYLWNNGETTEDLSGLSAGVYDVVVTDSNGCIATEEVVIEEPDMLSCEIVEDSPVSVHGGSDGVATVTPSGGTAPYEYLWSPGGATTAQATGLSAGMYTVTVTDSSGCETTCDVVITEPNPNELRCDIAKVCDVTCFEGEDGSAKVTVEGGVPPYKYLWDNGETTQTATGLSVGLRSVTVTDSSESETSCNIMIEEPLELVASAEAEGATTGCSCYGNSDGSIDLTVSGGTSPYTYLWNNGETTEDLSGLSAGVYDVVVTDSNGCIATEEVVIEEPDMLSCEIVEDSPVSVHGGSDGVATVTPSGGTALYEYLWSPGGATTAQATGLSAGMYTVTVTDSSGCETTCDVVITEPNPDSARAFCSYTQGFYGNPGGLACIPDSQKVNAKYIMLGALNASGGQVDFGDKNTNKYFRLFLGDIQNDNIFKLLPGGGPSKSLLGYATYNDNTTWSNVPLVDKGPRRGAIKNNLLSQTMTLYFNLHADKSLSSYQLEETFYTASTLDCGSEEYDETSIQMFKISSDVISYLELNDMATVQGLFELANRALGGNDIGSLSCSSITDAVDTINNGFDECRVLLPESVYDSVVQGLDNDKPIFSAYPIPFIDTINIRYEIDGATEATIQVFDLQGRLVKSIVDKDIYYHKVKTLDLDYKIFANQMYFIKVNTNNRSTLLKIISVK